MHEPLPTAWDALPALARAHATTGLILCLDYDGTLTPFPETPDERLLTGETRATLAGLAEQCPVALISGRAVGDLRALVGLESVIYSGNHGMEIEFAGEPAINHRVGQEFEAAVGAAAKILLARFGAVEGLYVQTKGLSISVLHPRLGEAERTALVDAIQSEIAPYPTLKMNPGRTHVEVRPALDWHKGSAVDWLRGALDTADRGARVVFIGDDATDEDALHVLGEDDVGVLVAETPRPTAARYRLNDHHEVGEFLSELRRLLARPG